MPLDTEFIDHLSKGGYHPRTSRHSDFLSFRIIRDVISACPLLKIRATAGEVTAKLRHHQQVGHADWVIDIAIGTCSGAPKAPLVDSAEYGHINLAPPVIIQIAIELKSIFTEHGKARRNRLRDFNAFHGYAHQYDPKTVAAAFLIVNSSERFYSPLRDANDITVHGTLKIPARRMAQNAVDIFRTIHLRNSVSDPPGMEAMAVVVVEHDNLAFHPQPELHTSVHRVSRIAPIPPSPPVGDPLHYQTMIQRICNHYTQRFTT